MKYVLCLFLSLFALTHTACAQESDSMAKMLFSMAQSAYADGQYKDALDHIHYAEISAGGVGSKSLYLKIRALNQLTNTDYTYLPDLQTAGNTFMRITDKETFPERKYQEIEAIMAQKGKLTASQNTITTIDTAARNKQEALDYDIAIKKNTMDGYKEFLDKYSFTPHYTDIKARYDQMAADKRYYHEHKEKGVNARIIKENIIRDAMDQFQ